MSILKELLRCIAPKLYYSIMTDEELKDEREQVRKKYISGNDSSLEKTLHLIDGIQLNRMNEKYKKEHPDAKPRHKEHGWYLPEDDD